jgi:hypothetical protein
MDSRNFKKKNIKINHPLTHSTNKKMPWRKKKEEE